MVIFGIVIAYWLDCGTTTNLTGEVVWRFPIAFQIFFALITFTTIMFLPETPRWLFAHGRKDESITVLARLLNLAEDDSAVRLIENEMEEADKVEHEQAKFKISHIWNDTTDVKTTRRLMLCFMIQMFQQFTGITPKQTNGYKIGIC